jgi:hypothetical protein
MSRSTSRQACANSSCRGVAAGGRKLSRIIRPFWRPMSRYDPASVLSVMALLSLTVALSG